MTVVMLLLASFGVATPLAIIGDRLSVFIPPGPFLSIMGRVGGYNHLKQLGVGSTIAGQLLFGAIGGAIYGIFMRRDPARRATGPDDVDLRFAANRRRYNRSLVGAGHELSRNADRRSAVDHAPWLRAQRFGF